jgi:hypothetical protein
MPCASGAPPDEEGEDDVEDEVKGDEGLRESPRQMAARLLMSGAGLLAMLLLGQLLA